MLAENKDQTHARLYNALDCAATYELIDAIPMTNQCAEIYRFERALQAPVLEMMLRGIRVDRARLEAARARLLPELRTLRKNWNDLCELIGCPTLESSPEQVATLFYHHLRLPVVMLQGRPTTGREALIKLGEDFPSVDPLIRVLLAIRDTAKQLQFLDTGIDSDDRFRCSYSIAGTETGRFSSSSNAFGTGCVPAETEVLTRNGWRRIDSIEPDQEVMQWDPQLRVLRFVPAQPYKTEYTGVYHTLKSLQISQKVTAPHRVPYWPEIPWADLTPQVKPAAEVSTRSTTWLPLSGQYEGGARQVPRWWAMLMADGSKESAGWRIGIAKDIKIRRLKWLLATHGIAFNTNKPQGDAERFYIPGQLHVPKKWGPWILDVTQESLAGLIDEAKYWDANVGKSFTFFTADEEQAYWFATAVHLIGKSASVRKYKQGEAAWGPPGRFMHCVVVKDRKYAVVSKGHWSKEDYSGTVYCLTVPSGFFLMRHAGKISVTGNSNTQNITDRLRSIFVPDKNMKLANFDLAQAEAWVVALLIYRCSGDRRMFDAMESGDIHTFVCKMAWPGLGWTGDPRADREIADQKSNVNPIHTYRDINKRVGHGSNYGLQPFGMSRRFKLPLFFCQQFQAQYYALFATPLWHQDVQSRLQLDRNLTTLYGRQRWFHGRLREASTLREAIAFEPQSVVGDHLNAGMLRVWLAGNVQLLAQVHDSILIQYPDNLPEQEELDLLRSVRESLLAPLGTEFEGRPLAKTIPVDCAVGYNWGKAKLNKETGVWFNEKGLREVRLD